MAKLYFIANPIGIAIEGKDQIIALSERSSIAEPIEVRAFLTSPDFPDGVSTLIMDEGNNILSIEV